MSESQRTRRPKSSAKSRSIQGGEAKTATVPAGRGIAQHAGPAISLLPVVQTKVVIGRVNDPFEREADSVAERVSAGRPTPLISRLPPGGLTGMAQRQSEGEENEEPEEAVQEIAVQRQEEDEGEEDEGEEEPEEAVQEMAIQRQEDSAGEEEPEEAVQEMAVQRQEEDEGEEEPEEPVQEMAVQRQEEDEGEEESEEPVQEMAVQRQEEDEGESIQAKADAATGNRRAAMSLAATAAIRGKGPGEPMARTTRANLEQHLGVDLSDVRVHQDGTARQAASALRARAFTHQRDIWLGLGESQDNVELMAHETTHVLQQGGIVRRAPQNTAEEEQTEEEESREAQGEPGEAATTAAPSTETEPSGAPDAMVEAPTPAVTPSGPAEPQPGAIPVGGVVPEDEVTAEEGQESVGAALALEMPAAPGAASTEEAETAPPAPAEEMADLPSVEAVAAVAPPMTPNTVAEAGIAPGSEATTESAERASTGPDSTERASTEREGEGPAAEAETGEAEGGEGAESLEQPSDTEGPQRFQAVLGNLGKVSTVQKGAAAAPDKARSMASQKSSQASQATPSPQTEPHSHGKAGQVEAMSEQEKGEVDEKSFLDLVKEKLRQMEVPANPKEMAEFKQRGGASGLKADLVKGTQEQKEQAQAGIAAATEAEPQAAPEREPVDLPPAEAVPAPGRIGAENVLPPPKTEAEVSLDAGKEEVEGDLAKEKLTKERLTGANDPRFSSAQESREEVAAHTEEGPKEYHQSETETLAGEQQAVRQDEATQVGQMSTDRQAGDTQVAGRQQTQISAEEQQRKEISDHLESIYAETKQRVDDKLAWLDEETDRLFTQHEERARQRFENFVEEELDKWKDRRYAGLSGKWTWIEDRFRDINELPAVKKIYEDGQQRYFETLDQGIDQIGRVIDDTLTWCQDEIKKGKEKVQEYLESLDENLKQLGTEAAEDIFERFDDLKEEVNSQRDALADKLVQRYQESREKLNARLEEIKDANRSLVIKAKRRIQAVLEAIENFRKRLMAAIRKAGDVIEKILDNPIQFLKNLLAAVKKGFNLFKQNIGKHLQTGIFGWLFGTLAGMGIQLPKDFSLKSIAGFIMQILGVTYDRMRQKVVRLIGARNVAVIEKVYGYLSKLFTEGPAGLWEEIKQDVGNLKEMVIDSIKEWVITKIVTAAVTKLVSMFNPAGAIVQAVLTIYNVVMFFVERIEQIMQLVQSIISSLGKIVSGNIDEAAAFVERTMAQMLPVIISFLARLLGIGGIAERIKQTVGKVQQRIDRAIDKALKKIVKRFKALVQKGKNAAKKAAKEGKAAIARLIEWWKIKKKFRQGKETHTLYFKGQKNSAQLMLASRPTALSSYIAELKGRQPPPDPQAVATIEEKIQEIDKLKFDPDKQQEISMSKERGKQIATAMKVIADRMAKLGGKDTRPPSKLKKDKNQMWGGDLDAQEIEAAPLSINPGDSSGSVPTQESALWKAVNVRTGTYIRGHMLNHHVHGPGEKKNMAPITRSLNSTMEKQVESKVKKAVIQENKVLSYRVTAVYGGHKPRKYVKSEQYLPTALNFEVHEMKLKQGAAGDKPTDWENATALNVPKQLKHDLPEDNEVGVQPEPVNLSTANKAQLMTIPGIGPITAQGILDLRRQREEKGLKAFHSYDQLEAVPGIASGTIKGLADKRWVTLH